LKTYTNYKAQTIMWSIKTKNEYVTILRKKLLKQRKGI